MEELKAKLATLTPLLAGRPVHFVDIPVYENVGDLLIMLGSMAFFNDHGLRLQRKAAFFNYRTSWASRGDIIVFQGGGNFGDLYRGPQQIRDRCIAELKKNRIVIFPQTIQFADPARLEDCRRLYISHPDLHICVRDARSFEIARELTPNVYLMPDMAHQLWPSKVDHPKAIERVGVLGFLRTDDEIGAIRGNEEFRTKIDWPEFMGKYKAGLRAYHRALRYAHAVRLDSLVPNILIDRWIGCAGAIYDSAKGLFLAHERVVTDRLHGHILSCLLGLENHLYDNSYGKNFAYSKLWTAESEYVTLCN